YQRSPHSRRAALRGAAETRGVRPGSAEMIYGWLCLACTFLAPGTSSGVLEASAIRWCFSGSHYKRTPPMHHPISCSCFILLFASSAGLFLRAQTSQEALHDHHTAEVKKHAAE